MKTKDNTNDSQQLQATARNTLQNSPVQSQSQKDSATSANLITQHGNVHLFLDLWNNPHYQCFAKHPCVDYWTKVMETTFSNLRIVEPVPMFMQEGSLQPVHYQLHEIVPLIEHVTRIELRIWPCLSFATFKLLLFGHFRFR